MTPCVVQRLIVASSDLTASLWMVRLPYSPPSEWGLGFIQVLSALPYAMSFLHMRVWVRGPGLSESRGIVVGRRCCHV